MTLHDTHCKDEILKHCNGDGQAFSDDTMLCLTQWTSESNLGESCKNALPKKEAAEDDAKVDAEKAAWRAKRKAERQAAMDQIKREEKAEKKKKKKKKKKSDL